MFAEIKSKLYIQIFSFSWRSDPDPVQFHPDPQEWGSNIFLLSADKKPDPASTLVRKEYVYILGKSYKQLFQAWICWWK